MKTGITTALVMLVFASVGAGVAWADDDDDDGRVVTPLTGETLITSGAGDPGTSQATGTCDPLGTSTFTFEVTGVAVGPYPGTFVERGTFTLGPAGFPLEAFEAEFTITSPAGIVTGTKTLQDVVVTHSGVCGEFAVPGTEPEAFFFQVPVRYTASITTPSGSGTDSGNSFVTYSETQLRGPGVEGNGFAFDESFESTEPMPTDDDDEDDDDDDDDDEGGDA
jgi:hypothetical protein